jgi:spore coat protein U-like protein
MKKIAVWFLAVGFVLTLSGKSMAADTANVTVSATVLSSCAFSNGGNLAFGNINPGVAGPYAPVVSDAAVQCNNGLPFTVTDDGGLTGATQMDDGLGNLLNYTFTYTNAGVGLGFGGAAFDVPLGINGSITQVDAQAVPPGAYGDTIVLSVLP